MPASGGFYPFSEFLRPNGCSPEKTFGPAKRATTGASFQSHFADRKPFRSVVIRSTATEVKSARLPHLSEAPAFSSPPASSDPA